MFFPHRGGARLDSRGKLARIRLRNHAAIESPRQGGQMAGAING